jgi:ABC-2 type transport system permease protein
MSVDRAGALLRLNTALLMREPGPWVSRLVMPLVLITLTRPLFARALGGAAGTTQAVAGMLVMFSLLGMSVVGGAILAERFWSTADRLRASPARRWELLAGKAMPVLALLLAQQALILGYGRLTFGLHVAAPPLLVGTVTVWATTLLCIGAALGTFARSAGALSAMVDVGSLTLTGLGGAFIPYAMLPGWAQAIAPVSPGYWGMKSLTAALDERVGPTLAGWAVLLAVAAVAAGLAGRRLATGWGRGPARVSRDRGATGRVGRTVGAGGTGGTGCDAAPERPASRSSARCPRPGRRRCRGSACRGPHGAPP